jgi:uncharacterized membrane protein
MRVDFSIANLIGDYIHMTQNQTIPFQTPSKLPAHLMYAALTFGLLSSWIGAVIAMVMAYVVRSDWRGTVLESHAEWVLGTFWWGAFWTILGYLLIFPLLVGLLGPSWLIWGIAWLWAAYRIIRGWMCLLDEQATP